MKYVLLALLLISSEIYAADTPVPQAIINCPRELQCMTSGDIDSCYISDNQYELLLHQLEFVCNLSNYSLY